MGIIETIFAGAATGGIGSIISSVTGIVGSWVHKREERKNLELRFKHDEKMAALDNDIIKYEAEMLTARAEITSDMEQGVAESGSMVSALEHDTAIAERMRGTKTGLFMDALRSMIRVALTLGAGGLVVWIGLELWELVGGLKSLPPATILELFSFFVMTSIISAWGIMNWWFGIRPPSKRKSV